jgi:hypothetical protein
VTRTSKNTAGSNGHAVYAARANEKRNNTAGPEGQSKQRHFAEKVHLFTIYNLSGTNRLIMQIAVISRLIFTENITIMREGKQLKPPEKAVSGLIWEIQNDRQRYSSIAVHSWRGFNTPRLCRGHKGIKPETNTL